MSSMTAISLQVLQAEVVCLRPLLCGVEWLSRERVHADEVQDAGAADTKSLPHNLHSEQPVASPDFTK